VAGLREYLDVELADSLPLHECMSALGQQFPSGLGIRTLMELAPSAPGLGKSINCAWYRVALPLEQAITSWQQAIEDLICGQVPICYKRPRDGNLFDVRSALAACRLVSEDNGLALDLLVELGDGSIPLRGLVETLLSLAEAAGGYEPGRVTRMALLHHNGGLVSPTGEQKRLWET
jgi:hypothetical protein